MILVAPCTSTATRGPFLVTLKTKNFQVITSELPVFLREHKSNIYSVEAYFLAKSIAELPQYTILPLIYGSVVYWMAGLVASPISSFFVFVFVCITLTWVAVSIG